MKQTQRTTALSIVTLEQRHSPFAVNEWGEWGNSALSRETERATALGRQATLGDGTEVLGFLALPCRMRRPLLMDVDKLDSLL